MSANHHAECIGCDDTFVAELARVVRKLLPASIAGLNDASIVGRIEVGVTRAMRQGATTALTISRYVSLMFALEPEFAERRRVREHIAATGGKLEASLESLPRISHPNCWYRVERSLIDAQWEALSSVDDVLRHPSLPVSRNTWIFDDEVPRQLSPDYGYQLDVPYFATPEDEVLSILEFAEVGSADTVMDLGSGDGRVVITAAARFGARGIGIELNPDLVQESRLAAVRAGVADRVVFHRRDLCDADLSAATVVTMYLLRDVNLFLRHRLLEQLRPGARIISRHFDMGDWKPDSQLGSGAQSIFCWRVPGPSTPALATVLPPAPASER